MLAGVKLGSLISESISPSPGREGGTNKCSLVTEDYTNVKGLHLGVQYVLYAFVGTQKSVNPRHYHLLVSDIPHPQVVSRTGTLSESGICEYILIITENVKVVGFNASLHNCTIL